MTVEDIIELHYDELSTLGLEDIEPSELNIELLKKVYSKNLKSIDKKTQVDTFQKVNKAFKTLAAAVKSLDQDTQSQAPVGIENLLNNHSLVQNQNKGLEVEEANQSYELTKQTRFKKSEDNVSDALTFSYGSAGDKDDENSLYKITDIAILRDLQIELEDMDYASDNEKKNTELTLNIIQQLKDLYDKPMTRHEVVYWSSVFLKLSKADFNYQQAKKAVTRIIQFFRNKVFINRHILVNFELSIPDILDYPCWLPGQFEKFVRSIYGNYPANSLEEIFIKQHHIKETTEFPSPYSIECYFKDFQSYLNTYEKDDLLSDGDIDGGKLTYKQVEGLYLVLIMELDSWAEKGTMKPSDFGNYLLNREMPRLLGSKILLSDYLVVAYLCGDQEYYHALRKHINFLSETDESSTIANYIEEKFGLLSKFLWVENAAKVEECSVSEIEDFPFFMLIKLFNHSFVERKAPEFEAVAEEFCGRLDKVDRNQLWSTHYYLYELWTNYLSFRIGEIVRAKRITERNALRAKGELLPQSMETAVAISEILKLIIESDVKLLGDAIISYLYHKQLDIKSLYLAIQTFLPITCPDKALCEALYRKLTFDFDPANIEHCDVWFYEELVFGQGLVKENTVVPFLEKVKSDYYEDYIRIQIKYFFHFRKYEEVLGFMHANELDCSSIIYIAFALHRHQKHKEANRILKYITNNTVSLRPSDYYLVMRDKDKFEDLPNGKYLNFVLAWTNAYEIMTCGSSNSSNEDDDDKLKAAFEAALQASAGIDDFCEISSEIVQNSLNIRQFSFEFANYTTKLMIHAMQSGNNHDAEKIMRHYVDVLMIHSGKHDKTSDVASNALVLAVITKNGLIADLVFKDLLASAFNVDSEYNKLLIFNLACYYAQKDERKLLLQAVKRAIQLGAHPDKFMSDADFTNYWGDEDFLHVLR